MGSVTMSRDGKDFLAKRGADLPFACGTQNSCNAEVKVIMYLNRLARVCLGSFTELRLIDWA